MYGGPCFLRSASANGTKPFNIASSRITKTSSTSTIRLLRSSGKVVSLTIEEIFFPYILLNALAAKMISDYAMVTTVRRGFAPRLLLNSFGIYLPSALISLVLEFSNEVNEKPKRACLWAIKNRAWMSKMSMFRNITTNVQIIWNIHPALQMAVQCPSEEFLRSKGAPLVRTWVRFLNKGVRK